YAWTADGTLQPTTALPSSPTATPVPDPGGAIGQPDGGQRFSMWQEAQPRYDGTSCGHGIFPIGLSATAWSPDGRYIAEGVEVFGRVDSADVGASQPTINCAYDERNSATHARMPARDAALKAVLLAEAHAADGNLTRRTLFWDPTG